MPSNNDRSFKASSPWLGVLPFIGVILFLISLIPIVFGDYQGNWQREVLLNAVVYTIGWAGVGAGISHIFFGEKISKSIGFDKNPYELEVGFADLSFGIVALLAPHFSTDYWFAVILVTSLYRFGCGIGHIRQIIEQKNYAVNNTAILIVDFVVPVLLLAAFYVWA